MVRSPRSRDCVTLSDLVFLLTSLSLVIALVAAAAATVRGRHRTALHILFAVSVTSVAYMGVVAGVALVQPGRALAPGESDCSDDWCIAVTKVTHEDGPSGRVYHAEFRLSSRARRATQRELHVLVYLRGTDGKRYPAEAGSADAPFDVRLGPLETVRTERRFSLPLSAHAADIVITRGGLPFPGCCIIGDPNSVLHKRTALRIE